VPPWPRRTIAGGCWGRKSAMGPHRGTVRPPSLSVCLSVAIWRLRPWASWRAARSSRSSSIIRLRHAEHGALLGLAHGMRNACEHGHSPFQGCQGRMFIRPYVCVRMRSPCQSVELRCGRSLSRAVDKICRESRAASALRCGAGADGPIPLCGSRRLAFATVDIANHNFLVGGSR
jgi:hypothetical protein